MNKPRILIVEDEANIRRFVRLALEQEGLEVHEAGCAQQARSASVTRAPDLMIVDLGLPDEDGKALIREIRSWSVAPIIVLSARESEAEKVAALDAGADDYLTKPFGVPELLARVRAQFRRVNRVQADGCASTRVRFGDVVVDLENHQILRAGEPVHLTRLEFRLLAALLRGNGKVLTSKQLLTEVWGPNHCDRVHYIRVYMMNLRQKLEEDPAAPRHLLTELQVGYRLAGLEPVESS